MAKCAIKHRAHHSRSIILLVAALSIPMGVAAEAPIRIGSKIFTESVVLGEIATRAIREAGETAVHRRELGGTRVLWSALLGGEVDIYPEYTGTLRYEILANQRIDDQNDLVAVLAARGLAITAPLGFENTYALGMRKERARGLGIERISDLVAHPALRFGFSNEFMDRGDGWPGLRTHYGLPQTQVRGLDHDLAYRGLITDDIDVVVLYSTDAEIGYYDLKVLDDDRQYFPDYHAVYVYRAGLGQRPAALDALRRLEGGIDDETMIDLNGRVKLGGASEEEAAAAYLHRTLGVDTVVDEPNRWSEILQRTREHLTLVGLSLAAALVVALPLGIVSARLPRIGHFILGTAGVIQTIPALALLVFMIPLVGIGGPPAILALFLYSLLPIIRNTYAGLTHIPAEIRESALALGLSPWARLTIVDVPMAMPSILTGIKIAAVINIGTATLGALIGAGGYGQPILTGIRLDDIDLILQGAIPAAVLAVVVQGAFEWPERYLVPKGLRL